MKVVLAILFLCSVSVLVEQAELSGGTFSFSAIANPYAADIEDINNDGFNDIAIFAVSVIPAASALKT